MMTNLVSFPGLGIFDITLNKVAFYIGDKPIYWYGIIIAVSFIAAFGYGLSKAGKLGVTTDDITDCVLLAIVLALVFARLYFVVFYKDPVTGTNTYFQGTAKEIFLNCIALWKGGSSIFGVLLGAVIAVFIMARIRKIPAGTVFDAASVCVPIGQIIGRLGNFVNCELYGVETAPDFFLRMEINGAPGVHPLFLYEMVWNVVVLILAHVAFKKRRFDGQSFIAYIGLYGLGRGVIEIFKGQTHMQGNIKISCVVGFACFVMALIVYIVEYAKNKPDPMRLYINRIRQAAKMVILKNEAVCETAGGAQEGESVICEEDSLPCENETTSADEGENT
ncbi:MAG: prolipoprotein diacylglyceryl transferase [Oscillospiraceae bacterium]|nr:prolipoprotein diacylglyceryl transferase [Oscillospiraceae bacterium]